MEIGKQIKMYRQQLHLSQEELADKIYVTRQTISNWETGKNYPDIHSLLMMSTLFDISLDQLVKGDIENMKKEIDQTEIKKFNNISAIFAILLFASVLLLVPLLKFFGWYGLIPWLIIYCLAVYYAVKIDRLKKDHDLSTYKEILAFNEGKQLDEIQKQIEIGKRPYQAFLYMIGSMIIAFFVVYYMAKMFSL